MKLLIESLATSKFYSPLLTSRRALRTHVLHNRPPQLSALTLETKTEELVPLPLLFPGLLPFYEQTKLHFRAAAFEYSRE